MANDGWVSTTLGECAQWFSGGTPSKQNPAYWGGDIPWVSAKDMKDFRLYDSQDHVTRDALGNGARAVPPRSILLLVRGMTLHDDLPICMIMREMTFNQDVKALVAEERVVPEFLAYWLLANKPDLMGLVDSASHGTGRIHTDVFKSVEVSLPPLMTQQRIADVLGKLDDRIELNRRMNRTMEKMAAAIFKSWFVDFDPVRAKAEGRDPGLPADIADLFPDSLEDSDLGEIPAGWAVKPIGEAVRCVGGATPSTKNPDFWEGGTHPFVTPKDMSSLESPVILDSERHITDAGVQKISSKQLPTGTVILSSRAPIGYLGIAEVPVSVNQGVIAMICDTDLPNVYVLHWTANNMDLIKSRAGGTTFAEISKKNFRPISVLVPSRPVLDAFMDSVAPFHNRIALNVRQNGRLAGLRDTLLPKLLSGEVEVPELEGVA